MKTMFFVCAFVVAAVLVGCSEVAPTDAVSDDQVYEAAKYSPACEMEMFFNPFWFADPSVPFYWGTMTYDDMSYGTVIFYAGQSGKPFLNPYRGETLHWLETIVTYNDDLEMDPTSHAVLAGTALLVQEATGLSMPNGRGTANGNIVNAAGPFEGWGGRQSHFVINVNLDQSGNFIGFSANCNLH
jgi:hypothetical protein